MVLVTESLEQETKLEFKVEWEESQAGLGASCFHHLQAV